MAELNDDRSDPFARTEKKDRLKIGVNIIIWALTAITILGAFALHAANSMTDIKDILAIILPLIGAWVGTILAFYFSRDNFATAAQQTANLVNRMTPEQRLSALSVRDVMRDMNAETTIKLIIEDAETGPDHITLIDRVKQQLLDKHQQNRLPVVDPKGKVLYIIHRSMIDKFLLNCATTPGLDINQVTLRDLLDFQNMASLFQSFAVVGKDAQLIAVKQVMDGNPNCADAFVTEDGSRGSRATGWITNLTVQEHASV